MLVSRSEEKSLKPCINLPWEPGALDTQKTVSGTLLWNMTMKQQLNWEETKNWNLSSNLAALEFYCCRELKWPHHHSHAYSWEPNFKEPTNPADGRAEWTSSLLLLFKCLLTRKFATSEAKLTLPDWRRDISEISVTETPVLDLTGLWPRDISEISVIKTPVLGAKAIASKSSHGCVYFSFHSRQNLHFVCLSVSFVTA